MKEIISIEEYSSPRSFHLFDAQWGSSCLLLHGFGGMFLGDAIDLLFMSTDYVQVPASLHGVLITQPCDRQAVDCERDFGHQRRGEEPEGKRVYAIESEGKRFHVIAAKMWVIVRTHDGKSSLPLLFGDDLAARESYIEQHIKEWYKMVRLS